MPAELVANPPVRPNRRRRRFTFATRLFGCFSLVGVATLFGGTVNHGLFLWMANGVLLAYLLLAPRRLWPWYLCAGLLANAAVSPWMHAGWRTELMFIPHDTIECLLAAALLRRRSADLPDFTNAFYLLRFTACALLVAPVFTSFLYAVPFSLWQHTPLMPQFGMWFLADSLGALVTAPACVAVFRSGLRDSLVGHHDWLLVAVVVAVCAALLGLPSFVGPCLLFPLLVFVLLRRGLGWASFATLAATIIAASYTSHGIGPYALSFNSFSPGIRLQGFTICVMVVLYSVSVVLENLRKTERRLQQIASLHALVAENSRDVIILLDFQGSRTFISAPDHFWGGWTRDEFRATTRFELLHPEDRKAMNSILQDLRTKKDGALIEIRVLRKDAAYAWLEASLRTVRDPISHLPTGVLANIREITERKEAEQQLEDAYHAVEALSFTDALTGLYNRRRFDQALAAEWRRALREQNPLSLLLIDADHFKAYNDTYGHPAGDACLQQIAEAVLNGASRSTDLAARIGGEEFAIILPNTSGPAARILAQRICEDVHDRKLNHAGSPHAVATVSIGCATVIPQAGQASSFLVDLADQALYSAKRGGRNGVYPRIAGDNDASPTVQAPTAELA